MKVFVQYWKNWHSPTVYTIYTIYRMSWCLNVSSFYDKHQYHSQNYVCTWFRSGEVNFKPGMTPRHKFSFSFLIPFSHHLLSLSKQILFQSIISFFFTCFFPSYSPFFPSLHQPPWYSVCHLQIITLFLHFPSLLLCHYHLPKCDIVTPTILPSITTTIQHFPPSRHDLLSFSISSSSSGVLAWRCFTWTSSLSLSVSANFPPKTAYSSTSWASLSFKCRTSSSKNRANWKEKPPQRNALFLKRKLTNTGCPAKKQ